jgi:hypothetical protein
MHLEVLLILLWLYSRGSGIDKKLKKSERKLLKESCHVG